MSASVRVVAPSQDRITRPLPLFDPYKIDLAVAQLGKDLFEDPRLSSNNTVSCATCHEMTGYGTQALANSPGVQGVGPRNSPTVFNASLNPMQFWDGRALTLEQQLDGPIHNPLEMDSSWPQVIDKLQQDPVLSERFNTLLNQPISEQSIKYAISYFEQQLLTPDAPFDQHLRGDHALTSDAKAGWQRFVSLGCAQCHQGINLGGNIMQTFGLTHRHSDNLSDMGLRELTGDERDTLVFRVPSLRNVAMTAPYFHDGSVNRLRDAVEIMAMSQLGKSLSEQELDELVAFLSSLTAPPPPILALLQ
ncbi:cytochrome c peroxidase [Ferrimonas pelagia]|uniref:Cytochrome c peroxidase n=2 Tax=Ferrimonas pelagia TaxID=1177826 RepID=A0ABP9ERZ3_9GAMM